MSKEISSLKKAYCLKCFTSDEMDRIFYVNPDANVCFCPNCMASARPKDVIYNYNRFISHKINKANRLLFRDTKFYDAYCAYGTILEIDSEAIRARFGRLLSLVYMSKLRKSHFLSAALIIKNESEQYFRKMKEQNEYLKFLLKINEASTEYRNLFVKRICYKERFYDSDCIELYFLRMNEIIEFKKCILDELDKMSLKIEDIKLKDYINELNETIHQYEMDITEKAITVEGYIYQLVKVVNPKQVLFSKLSEVTNPINRYKPFKLNESEKKGKLIKDKVYPDNSTINKLIRAVFPFIFVFIGLASGMFVFALFSQGNRQILANAFLIASGVGFLVTTGLYIKWKVQLSRRHHLID